MLIFRRLKNRLIYLNQNLVLTNLLNFYSFVSHSIECIVISLNIAVHGLRSALVILAIKVVIINR